VNPNKRWKNGNGYSHNQYFHSAILKYGWNNIKHEILCVDLTKEEAELNEIELIAYFNSADSEFGYNIDNGGNHAGKISEESKRKMSEKKKNNPTKYWQNKSRSEEAKKKISESLVGKYSGENHPSYGKHLSEETRKKISESKTGKSTSKKGSSVPEEVKKKISHTLTGRKQSPETVKKRIESRKRNKKNKLMEEILC
jgi:group I intron endonuclease